jgi:arylformamidase
MIFFINKNQFINTDLGKDLSLPLINNDSNPRAWYVSAPKFEPVNSNGFIGSVKDGGSVNFRNVFFNPHGHGTHTECLGHITNEVHSINQCFKHFFLKAKIVTVNPIKINDDFVIIKDCFEVMNENEKFDAIVIRTLPNTEDKKSKNYSSTNPPFLDLSVMEIIEKHNINHLLIDLPSVDKESDGGKLAFHHAFWQVPENPQFNKTITELIFVSDEIKDGNYILNLQTAPFENDATPSRPVVFEIFQK